MHYQFYQNVCPYRSYPLMNEYCVRPVSSQVQYSPVIQEIVPQKEAIFGNEVITHGEFFPKEGPIFKEEHSHLDNKSMPKQFINHLHQRKASHISVGTLIKEIEGELQEVSEDYIVVNNDGQLYHIRLEGIIYIS
ncbi:DUF2642 domain-containing protein [Aneurinibacillus sp. Ricciae_BoGa-3]|uniref:DUF2642 domain-containing protein n=1 Tax=Aneurinibacillus sp. Ricciae_BoGa-3 TaxID=3022697 RepID=UPI00234207AD|nr:DUF2642 domain-containing protein [Aneurinibacillus sp. Ricciae_BoGa-3]WCK52367.1 DUF2642 domain-containing protein [Aneurinibacillus sp. Ricciae_BoGa-3]